MFGAPANYLSFHACKQTISQHDLVTLLHGEYFCFHIEVCTAYFLKPFYFAVADMAIFSIKAQHALYIGQAEDLVSPFFIKAHKCIASDEWQLIRFYFSVLACR